MAAVGVSGFSERCEQAIGEIEVPGADLDLGVFDHVVVCTRGVASAAVDGRSRFVVAPRSGQHVRKLPPAETGMWSHADESLRNTKRRWKRIGGPIHTGEEELSRADGTHSARGGVGERLGRNRTSEVSGGGKPSASHVVRFGGGNLRLGPIRISGDERL